MSKNVTYLYNEQITNYELSKEHPMKTKRIKMAHSLIYNYDLTSNLKMFYSKEANIEEMMSFHHPHYIKYLQSWVSPQTSCIVEQYSYENELKKIRQNPKLASIFKVNESFDCPGFDGLYGFCKLVAGGSIDAADLIITGEADISINWSGGFHHAKKTQASGFCYVNDVVICILELLKAYPRILYLDIDVHHGDGVQQAFYHTNRVMTVSFHEFQQDFFPGTGALDSIGEGIGKYFTVNIPLKRGIDDQTYVQLFKKVMSAIMSSYRPNVVVIQCGADNLSKDKLGHLNLSILGHTQCLLHMRKYNIPLVLLGGGGYTIENVSRCWTYETAKMCGVQIDNNIPANDYYYQFYGKEDFKLLFSVQKRFNQNSPQYLDAILERITENLREAQIRPSVCFHTAPKNFIPSESMDFQMISDSQDSLTDYLP